MIVGIPKEVKDRESRVSATPAAVHEYVASGHEVIVETQAGLGSGFSDDEYTAEGARIVATHEDVFAEADMIVKVKEPIASEYDLLREGQILYTYLHLAADEPLTRTLVERGVQAVAYETVQLPNRHLPLLAPMSEVAGRMSIQVGAHYLESPHGGIGTLLGGVPGVHPGEVVVIGGGAVGTNAAKMALGLGANVTIIELSLDRLRYLDDVLHGRINLLVSTRKTIADAVARADLVVGSVLIPGAKAPKLVTADMVQSMRAGSVMVDVAIDQGGCFETSRPTTHSDPTYVVDDVIHYCVTNMPGAVARTSTLALSSATLPYGIRLASHGFIEAVSMDEALGKGVNVMDGKVTHKGVSEAFNMPYVTLADAIATHNV